MRQSYLRLSSALEQIEVEDGGYETILRALKLRPRVLFIGNGGSAAIASHMTTDFMKNGRFPALCFNDGSLLTCITNDLGYENAFALPIARHGTHNDLLFAISSSGESQSIIQAVKAANGKWMNVVTLSGFKPSNALRQMGNINFYVPSEEYGTVEIAHLSILHSLLDEVMTWQ